MVAVADKLGIGTAETVRKGVRRAEIDGGLRQGAATGELAEIKRLKCEVAAQLTVSRSTAAIRAASSLVVPARWPPSISARTIQFRNVSGLIPSCCRSAPTPRPD